MSDNQEVSVKITADVKSLLQGMKDAKENTETAVAGMKGDLGSMIESFEKFGGAALAIGAVGLAFEGLKESVDFIKEAVAETNELAESFKSLAYQTGASYEELNVLATAQALEGGSIRELEGWMKGATRSIKANADMLVENGIAANKAALMTMPFTEYLKKVMEAADGIQDPFRRGVFLTEALGRAGMEAAPNIREMLEQLKGAPEVLDHFGRKIGKDNVADMERFKHAAGEGTVAMRGFKQSFAETFGAELTKGTSNWAKFIASLTHSLPYINAVGKGLAATAAAIALPGVKPFGSSAPGAAAPSPEGEKTGKGSKLTSELDAEKKARADAVAASKAAHIEEIAIAKAAAAEELKAAIDGVEGQIKADQHLVAMGKMSFAEMTADTKAQALVKLQAQEAEAAKGIKLAEGNKLAIQGINDKLADDHRKYSDTIKDLDNKMEANGVKEAENAAKLELELASIEATGEIDLQKTILEEKDRALDQSLAYGRINEAQWVAMKKAGITQELRAEMDALDKKQIAAKDDLAKWKTIQNQKDALNHKAYLDMGKIEAEALDKSRARWSSFFGSMTGGFDSAIQGLVKGTMTWGDAFKTVTDQALTGIISFFVQWAEEEAIKWATGLAMGETGRVTEATGAAAVYAVNAMGSVAAIPMVGWAMAPGVGAAAYGEGLAMAGLASAAGGWDRVPSDQVAQIHKNEMILPAHIAEPVRQMAERGGGGQPIQITIQALDGQDVHRVLTKHQDSLFRIFREGGKNGRL